MNEPSIEMMQSISVNFCFLICSIFVHWSFFFLAFHLLQVGFLTRGQVTRAVAREFEGNVETTELMAREDFLGHPTKTCNTSWHIKRGACSSTSLCIFMICWSENFEKAGYLTWNAWIWSKTSGRKQLRWDFFCSVNSQLWRFSRCQEALAKPVTPRSRAWSPVFRRSLVVRWFFGFQGRRFAKVATPTQVPDEEPESPKSGLPFFRFQRFTWLPMLCFTFVEILASMCFNWPPL